MRAVARNEMQLDAATGPRQTLLHQLGVMVARIVEIDMDEHHQRIKCLDRFEQRDRRGSINGLNVDHPGLPALEIDGAVNIDALAPARLFDRKLVLLGRPAADWPRRMARMDRISEQHDLVIAQGIQSLVVVLDERLLLVFIELAGDDIGLVIFEIEAVQQRDQSRAAFVNEAEFLRDEGADLPRRARQRGSDKGFQGLFLHSTQKACAAAYVKTGEPLDAALLKQLVPAADRVVVQQKRCRDFLTAPPVVQQHQSVRPPRQARRRRAVARQRDQMLTIIRAEKAAANHAPSESTDPQKARQFSRLFNESGYIPSDSRAATTLLMISRPLVRDF